MPHTVSCSFLAMNSTIASRGVILRAASASLMNEAASVGKENAYLAPAAVEHIRARRTQWLLGERHVEFFGSRLIDRAVATRAP